MDVLTYATGDDLLDGWLSSLPGNADAMIRKASVLVDDATRFDCYETDDFGAPVDPDALAAFRAATCQQVAAWVAAGLDPDAGGIGQAPQIASQSTEGDSVTYANRATITDLIAATDYLCRASQLILRNAGLASRVPRML